MVNRTRTLETLEIIGGSLCLDFANTINSRREPEHDYLEEYSDLVNWAIKVGVLSISQGERLRSRANLDEVNASEALQKAVELRELLFQLFSNLSRQSEPPHEVVRTFVTLYAESISHGILQKKRDTLVFDWEMEAGFDVLLWPIIYSAGQLLLSEKLVRLKECPGCGW